MKKTFLYFKNWFKNKRSRVLADSKSTSNKSFELVANSSPAGLKQDKNFQHNQQQLYIQTNMPSHRSNLYTPILNQQESLNKEKDECANGLLNIKTIDKLNKMKGNYLKKPIEADKTDLKDVYCHKCSYFSQLFCKCHVSKQALCKLYSSSFGYNVNLFNFLVESYNDSYVYNLNLSNFKECPLTDSYLVETSTESNQKIFEIL